VLSHYYALPGALLLVMALCFGVAAVLVTREVAKRKALVKRKSRTMTHPYRPKALTGIDFLVVAAIALTFVAIASTTI
jgi:hypothetical protein